MSTQTFTKFLAAWKGDRTNVECARILGIDGGTFGTWLMGQRTPPGSRRAEVAKALSITPAEIEALIASDRINGMPGAERVGIRIDTGPQAREWVDTHSQPTPAAQGV